MWEKTMQLFCRQGLGGRFCVTAAEEMARELPEMSPAEFMDRSGFADKYGKCGIQALIEGLEDPDFYEVVSRLKKGDHR